jgi:hypothetical protein
MVEQTIREQRLAALYATLAKATTACPGPIPELACTLSKNCYCKGTFEVARFPGFRQMCEHKDKLGWPPKESINVLGAWRCRDCGARAYLEKGKRHPTWIPGTGWQVRAGDSADGLAGLGVNDAYKVTMLKGRWISFYYDEHLAMPSALKIRVKELELICIEAGLEVPE